MPNDLESLLLQRSFNWDDLRIFVAVADAGSLKQAAGRLLLTQPTVTKRLDVLESALDVRLLDRSHRGVELTDAGRIVFRYAQSMRRSAYDLHREISGLDSECQGKVKVFIPDGLAGHWVAPRLAEFYEQHPEIGLEFVSSLDTSFVPEMHVDVAVQIDECKHVDAIATRLGFLHYLPYATVSYLENNRPPKSLAELSNHRILHHLNYRYQSDHWGEKVKALEHILSFAFMTNCSTALLNSVHAGAGMALLPTYVESFAKDLRPIDLGIHVKIEFWAVFHRDNGRIARVRAFLDWIKVQFNSTQFPWFAEHLYSLYLPERHPHEASYKSKGGRPINLSIRSATER